MNPEQLLENFKTQQSQLIDEIRTLDSELTQKKELYVKLQGAIEGLSLLNPPKEETESEDSQMETVALAD